MEEDSITTINTVVKKKPMTQEYYPVWAQDMDLLLSSNGLDTYIYDENFKIISCQNNDKNISKYTKIKGTKSHYYNESATDDMIKKDNRTKQYISRNLDDNTKRKINFKTSTAYTIWKLLKDTYTKSDEEKKLSLRATLDTMMFKKEDDIEMYLSNLNNIFNELKELNDDISEEEKFNYLYNSLPPELAQATEIITFQDKWEECCDHLKKTIPRLKFLEQMRVLQRRASAYSNETKVNRGVNRNSNHNSSHNNNKNIKCYNCGKYGHKSKDCKSRS